MAMVGLARGETPGDSCPSGIGAGMEVCVWASDWGLQHVQESFSLHFVPFLRSTGIWEDLHFKYGYFFVGGLVALPEGGLSYKYAHHMSIFQKLLNCSMNGNLRERHWSQVAIWISMSSEIVLLSQCSYPRACTVWGKESRAYVDARLDPALLEALPKALVVR